MNKFKKIRLILLFLVTGLLFSGCFRRPVQPAVSPDPLPSLSAVPSPSASSSLPPSPSPTPDLTSSSAPAAPQPTAETVLDEGGSYDQKDDVALYLVLYGHLPSNYMTKKEARARGWSSGALHLVVPGKCIGGDVFGNYEELLPEQPGRTYHECDIDTLTRKSRGKKRIVYSNDGLIFYTDDHYESFVLLYGEEEP